MWFSSAPDAVKGSLLGLSGVVIGIGATWVNANSAIKEARRVQVVANRHQAYMQIKGEQAEYLLLFQRLLETGDLGKLYQVRSLQFPKGEEHASYTADAIQQERNAERYEDDLISCSEKLYESVALAQVSFPQSDELDSRIESVENMLVSTRDLVQLESPQETLEWTTRKDSQREITNRSKQHMAPIIDAVQPVTNLLSFLSTKMDVDLP